MVKDVFENVLVFDCLSKKFLRFEKQGVWVWRNDFEPEPWLEYLKTTNYTDWIHVSDNPLINAQDSAASLIYSRITDLESLNFRTTFDVFSTPKLFLLDENKKILAKQIGALQLAEMLYRLEGLEPPHPEFFLSEEAIEKIRRSEEQDKKNP